MGGGGGFSGKFPKELLEVLGELSAHAYSPVVMLWNFSRPCLVWPYASRTNRSFSLGGRDTDKGGFGIASFSLREVLMMH